MEFIVSTKYLAKQLTAIDFETDFVKLVSLSKQESGANILSIVAGSGAVVDVLVETNSPPQIIKQYNRKWDWVYMMMKESGDQPCVISIQENRVRISFDY